MSQCIKCFYTNLNHPKHTSIHNDMVGMCLFVSQYHCLFVSTIVSYISHLNSVYLVSISYRLCNDEEREALFVSSIISVIQGVSLYLPLTLRLSLSISISLRCLSLSPTHSPPLPLSLSPSISFYLYLSMYLYTLSNQRINDTVIVRFSKRVKS